jgi:hypothetical protein
MSVNPDADPVAAIAFWAGRIMGLLDRPSIAIEPEWRAAADEFEQIAKEMWAWVRHHDPTAEPIPGLDAPPAAPGVSKGLAERGV